MQRVFISVVNAAACPFQKRVPSRVTGDVKKVHYRRHARTCVMYVTSAKWRGMQGRVRPRRAPSFVSVANGWRVVPKVNEDCAVHVRHAKEKVACRRRSFNRCVHIARSARNFFMFLRFGVILPKQSKIVKWNLGLHYSRLCEIIIAEWSSPAHVGIIIRRIIRGRAIAVMVMVA